MADAQATALADLSTAISNIADAIAAEIQALQNAVNAAANIQPDDSAAIEQQVTKLNQLTAALKAPLAPVSVAAAASSNTPAPTPPAASPAPVSPSPVTPAP